MNKPLLGLISAIINSFTIIPYVIAVSRKQVRPSRATWLIWSFLSWVIFFASLASGAHATLFWLASSAINAIAVTALSFWRGTWEKSKLEVWCLVLGLLGVGIWFATREAQYSVYISLAVNMIAIIPLIRHVWKNPKTESKVAWSIGFIAAFLNVLVIDSSRAVIFLPPLVVLAWHFPVLYPMYFRIKKRK